MSDRIWYWAYSRIGYVEIVKVTEHVNGPEYEVIRIVNMDYADAEALAKSMY